MAKKLKCYRIYFGRDNPTKHKFSSKSKATRKLKSLRKNLPGIKFKINKC